MTEIVYVERDGEGAIKGVYANPQPGYATEALAADHPDVVAFLTPSPVPAQVTIRQARRVLDENGLLDAVDAWVATQSTAVQIDWQSASFVERNSPLIAEAADALDLSGEQLDQLFIAAAAL